MAITWILVAHGSSAKILELKSKDEKISEVKNFIHPRTAKKAFDISADQPQEPEDMRPTLHAIDYSGEMEDHEREIFAKEIAAFLAKALEQKDFNKLILVSSHKMLGELRKALANPVKKVVEHELNKDLIPQGLSNAELVHKIRQGLIGL